MNVARTVVPILLVGLAAAAPAWAGEDCHDAAPVSPTRARELYGQLPLHFEANQGQTDARVRFLARGSGYALFLTPSESVLVLRGPTPSGKAPAADVLRFRLAGADPADLIDHLIFAATAADVTHVVAGGKQIVRDGHHLQIDVPAALSRAIGALA